MLTPSPFEPGDTAPRLLVSVRDADEALAAALAGADLVDAKDPVRGALGALPVETVHALVARVGARAVTSAVAGEPTEGAALAPRVAAMAATGVDYVKVAVRVEFSDADLAEAAGAAPGRLIAVLFAEPDPAPGLVARLAAAGFVGAMIDTATKDGRRLPDLLPARTLAAFTLACRRHGLVSGLAGSLALADIETLTPLGAQYLGFRGGLCHDSDRTKGLDPARVAEAMRILRARARRDAA
ncbi:(5-formylfuran-3-yl)methyl phosphate synthase [Methylobacterium sp. J-090]|uniref:(5-formylfuran-3-yl)methyl phosphate synthase n=1 Tax=Methylobacterium sp. J-090 TaxID=2836666 RepID=UPI001FBAD020|nr:(5-formylfuran-3-yl)methyl phosphate synthase [Methylobacterium sp. J-090]MCJ2080067.1 (5-formylfuran-3-yl)methyl phosphate synthase [Methylobacterium sp. J-090]